MDILEPVSLSFFGATPSQPILSLFPVILLHGVTTSKEIWANVMHKVSNGTGRVVFSLDARNHGDSGWSDDMDYNCMADDVSRFMKLINAEKVTLIGHSMGGKTAMNFALKKPGKVEKLIVEDISPKGLSTDKLDGVLKYLELLRQTPGYIPPEVKSLEAAKAFILSCISSSMSEQHCNKAPKGKDSYFPPLRKSKNGTFEWKANLDGIVNSISKGFQPLIFEGVFQGPSLFVCGTKSQYHVSNDKGFILNLFPKATFMEIEGATHDVHMEYEDEFVEKVVKFLNDV